MALTGNITTDTTELVKTYYEKKALLAEKPFFILEQFADKSKDIPKYKGATVTWWKRIPMTPATTPLTEGTSPSAEDLEFQNVSATVAQYGKVVAISDFLGFTAIDPEISSKVESLGENRAQSVNRLYWQEIVKRAYPMRVDQDSSYEGVYTADATASTTTFIDDALTQADDYWNGGVIAFINGTNKGMGGYVTDFVASSDTVTFTPAVNDAPTATRADQVKLATSTGITAADPLDCAAVDRAVKILRQHHAQTFGGYYIGVLSPFTQYDIRQDPAWINADEYAGSEKLYNGEIGQWNGVRFVLDTDPWRSAAGTMGTYSASGAVFHTPIFGKEAYAGVRVNGVQDKLIFHSPEQTGDDLEMYSTAGWKICFAVKVLNATWIVQILSGASDIS